MEKCEKQTSICTVFECNGILKVGGSFSVRARSSSLRVEVFFNSTVFAYFGKTNPPVSRSFFVFVRYRREIIIFYIRTQEEYRLLSLFYFDLRNTLLLLYNKPYIGY